MGTGLPPTVDSTSIPGSSSSIWTVITSEDLSSQFPRTEEWENITFKELVIDDSLNSLSQVDYRNLTADSFQKVRSTLENLINVLMPQGADSLIPFNSDADQEKLLSHIQSYFEHSPTWDSARMVEYWIHATVNRPVDQTDQRKTNFHNLIQIMSAEGKTKTRAVINSLVESYSYALSHIHGVKDDTDQKEMLEYIHHALKEEDSLTAQTKVRTLGHLAVSFPPIEAQDNKDKLQQIVDELLDQAELLSEDRGKLICNFLEPLEYEDIPVDWALNKVDFLSQKGDLFSPTEIMAKNIGCAMALLTRYFRQTPELSDQIKTDALNLLERLATQPILLREKEAIQTIFTLARNDDDIQPFRERLHNIVEKIKLLPLRGQAPDTLA